jgi:cbb3-type cytochrome oxidase maturation protein
MIFYIIIFVSMMTAALIALYGFYWAAKTGQFKDFEQGSKVIFDKDETIGKMTDAFPKK